MVYGIGEIVRDVRVVIDENRTDMALIAEGDLETLELDDVIRSKVEDGAKMILQNAPLELLETGHQIPDDILWKKNYSGEILLPDDFLRLIVFRMSDWERPVYRVITPEDGEYAKQHSRLAGIRGNVQKPVVAIVNRPEGRVLEFYSCKSDDAFVESGMYLPYPKVEKCGIDLPERCYRPVLYTIAGLVMLTYGEGEKAKAFNEAASTLISN